MGRGAIRRRFRPTPIAAKESLRLPGSLRTLKLVNQKRGHMAVHVGEMSSEVTAESDSPAAAATSPPQWDDRANVREMQAQLRRDALRTAAEGYDD